MHLQTFLVAYLQLEQIEINLNLRTAAERKTHIYTCCFWLNSPG